VSAGTHVRVLADGVELPMLGFGTWLIPDGEEARRSVAWALDAGYRHLDTAQAYGNEASVGRALRESGLPREDVFVTTKFNPGRGDPVAEAERSLERLGIERIDLYLVHTPMGGPTRAWPGMERALERGLTRAIGVSNFDAGELERVVASASTPPAVNQVQLSPFQNRRRLLEACDRLGVAPEAYSPLTHGADLDHPTLVELAASRGLTPAQVLLRWGIQRNLVVIPKSANRERIAENAAIFGFTLSGDEMATLDALDRTGGTGRAVERKWWTPAARARDLLARIAERLRS
jgi:2,5-diketo-D-gluconate reductase A